MEFEVFEFNSMSAEEKTVRPLNYETQNYEDSYPK